MRLKQPEFTYSACGPFTESNERIAKFKETGDTKYIYRNECGKACFQHGMTYSDFKNLSRRAVSDKVLKDKEFNIAKNPNHDGYQRCLASMVYKCFGKKSSGGAIKSLSNQQLANELHKKIIKFSFFKKSLLFI